ncbi:MAG: ABC transporter substrate-binding protein [Candidatus Schekmanbacteria bacterium]|nr:ABC transporter substrate-binding protein [Candidatus Schekmanbacteria bacterium]
MRRRRCLSWLVAVLVVCATSGCRGAQTGGENELVVGLVNFPGRLDPRFATDAVAQHIDQVVYAGLLRRNRELGLDPDLATAWSVSEDGLTYNFTLRSGVVFHDGRPLTAADVAYTYESLRDPAVASPKAGALEALASVTSLDDHRVAFTLKQPFASFPINCVLGVVPSGTPPQDVIPPPGAGPFKVDSIEDGETVVVRAHDQYFGPRAGVDRIVFRAIPSDTTRVLELEKGSIHFLQNDIPPADARRLATTAGIVVDESEGTDVAYLAFNLDDPALAKAEVRRAIALTVDRAGLIRSLLDGQASPADSLLAPIHWAHAPDLPPLKRDVVAARTLLEQAGLRDPDGDGPLPRLSLALKTSQNPFRQRVAEFLANDLRQIGIDMKIQTYEWGKFFSDVQEGRFQMFSLQWVGVSDPDLFHMVFHSARVPPGGANRGRYRNADVDRLADEARTRSDDATRAAAYQQIQRILAQDLPYIYLWHPRQVVARRDFVTGFKPYPTGDYTALSEVRIAKR